MATILQLNNFERIITFLYLNFIQEDKDIRKNLFFIRSKENSYYDKK